MYIVAQDEGFAPEFCSGGSSYEIYMLDENTCQGTYIGWVDTCGAAEDTGVGYLFFEDVPDDNMQMECWFNGPVVGNKFKSIGGECDVYTNDWGNWAGMSVKIKFQAKEKNIAKKLDCTIPDLP